jgi:2-iminobutanoate/2-iminopropanoate deaminase
MAIDVPPSLGNFLDTTRTRTMRHPRTINTKRGTDVTSLRIATLVAAGLLAAGCASPPAKQIHSTGDIYPAIGPYSQMVQAGHLVFLSGVIPLNKAGNAVQGTTIEEQTRLVLDYIGAKLKSRGLGYEDVVMSTVYMKNLNDFATMNGIYAQYFKTAPPSRATVEVSRLPRDVLIEIAVVAQARPTP